MTRASDLARLIGAGGTVANDVTISEGSPSIKLNDTDTSRFMDILYGTRNATFRNTMASGEDMDTVAPETIFSTKDDGETREHFRMNKSEAVFNEGSADLDFRVESNDNANMLVVDGGLNAVSIGGGPSTNYQLKVAKSDGSAQQLISAAANFNSTISFGDPDANTSGEIIYAHNGDSMRFHTNGGERVRITSGGLVGINTTNPTKALTIQGTGATLRLEDNTSGRYADIENSDGRMILRSDPDNAVASSRFVFEVDGSEAMRVTSSLNLVIGQTSTEFARLHVTAPGSATTPALFEDTTTGTSSVTAVVLKRNGTNVGAINTTNNSTAYVTSSDYRLKENIDYTFDATTRLKQLKPCRFNFITDADNTVDGFLAHEVSSIVPEAISGEKDAVDDDGNIISQGIDQSKLVPLLVKTIQELEARIATLESK